MKIALIWIVYSLCIFAFIIPSSVLAASPGHLACGVDIPSESEPETESEESVPEESTPDKSCAEGLTFIGCCDTEAVTWCENGETMTLSCKNSCGWNGVKAMYDCGQAPMADPSGQFAYGCDGGNAPIAPEEVEEAVQEEPEVPVDTDPCSKVGFGVEGCCDGKTLTWCENGAMESIGCATTCGWNGFEGVYECDYAPLADPTHTFPLVCLGGEVPPALPDNIDDNVNEDSEEAGDEEEFVSDLSETPGTGTEEGEGSDELPTGTTTQKEEEENEIADESKESGSATPEEPELNSASANSNGFTPQGDPNLTWLPQQDSGVGDGDRASLESQGGCSESQSSHGVPLLLLLALIVLKQRQGSRKIYG